MSNQPPPHLSKEFFEFVKSIGESRSKQEEDKIVIQEVTNLKLRMGERNVTPKRMREYLMRMIYCEMLGHDASFGHIHAVNLAHTKNILDKRAGYLAVSLTLNPDHQFMLLLINTIQNDLKSENFMEVSFGLTVVCKLVSVETIPALLPLVVKLLEHKEGVVRKKAIMALHRFNVLDPSSVSNLNSAIRKSLCDSNISVMAATLHVLLDVAVLKPAAFKDLVGDLVGILKQVIEHRLPRDYDYHRIPAPWVQISILKILAVLGSNDKAASEGMYELLHEVMKRADVGINIGYAIVYETVRTITGIYPEQALIEDAALAISRFITSENHNLKYLGVTALASIVQIDPKYAAEHQLVVIDCLEDPDDTLRRKTLDLLYSMTNPANVTVVVDKLMGFLKDATDQYMRTDLLTRISQLAEKYAPTNAWYIQTMNTVMELADDLVQPEMAHSVMRLINDNAAGSAGDEDLREFSVDTYLYLLQNRKQIPDLLLQITAWVIGEYGHLSQQNDLHSLINALILALDRNMSDQAVTRGWIISAMLKLTAHLDQPSPEVFAVVTKYQNSLFLDLQQRAHEFLELCKTPNVMKKVLPPQGGSEQVDTDESLSFLNGYVDAALQAGAKPYQARMTSDRKDGQSALKYAAYSAPTIASPADAYRHQQQAPVNPYTHGDPNAPSFFGAQNGAQNQNQYGGANSFNEPAPMGGAPAPAKRLWGPSGFNDPSRPQGGAPQQQQQQQFPPSQAAVNPYTNQTVQSSPQQQQDFAPSYVQQVKKERAPPPPSEKEKLASSLFGGLNMGGSAAGGPPTAAPRRGPPTAAPPKAAAPAAAPVKPAAATPAPVAAPPKAAAPDFMNLFDAPAPAPAAAPAPASTNLNDIFGGMTTNNAPQRAAPQQAAPAPALKPASNDFMDLFGGGAPAPVQKAAPAQSSGGFADMFGGPAVSAPVPSSGGLLDDAFGFGGSANGGAVLGAAGASANIRKQLDGHPKSSTNDTVIAQDSRVQISFYKVYSPESTQIAFFISNKSAQPIANFQVSMTLPGGLGSSFGGDPAPNTRPGAQPGSQAFFYASIAPKTTTTAILSLQVRDFQFLNHPSPWSISGQVSYAGLTSILGFNLSVDLPDLLRPSQMSTTQYGAHWKQYTDEAKGSVRPSPAGSPQEFMKRMLDNIRIFPVQTIGAENIVAGRLVSAPNAVGAQNLLCFVHGKTANNGVDIIVRSKSQALSQALLKQLAVTLR